MIAIDYEIKACETYYSNLHGSVYHVRFSPSGDGWRADMIQFSTIGTRLKSSKEHSYGKSMLDAVKNLKDLLHSTKP